MRLGLRFASPARLAEQRYPPIGGFVTVPGGIMHYLADGPAKGVPVVLIHGASGNLRDWALSLLPRIARRHRVIAIDRPGFGHSAPLPGAAEFPAQIAALRHVLHRLGHSRAILVGQSYAGPLALAWALRHPEEVAGICVLAGATMDWGGKLGPLYSIGGRPLIGPVLSRIAAWTVPESYIRSLLQEVFAPDPVPERYHAEGGVELAVRPHTLSVNLRAMNRLHGQVSEQVGAYPRIACPVEIVHGTADEIVPAGLHAEGLHRVLPRSRLTLIEGIGHMPHHHAPEEVLAAIRRLADAAK